MKIVIKKKSTEEIVKEEIEKILSEAKSGKIHNRYIVKKQRNGKRYPGIQYLWDTRTRGVLQSLDKLKEAESGSWYQTNTADSKNYEEAFQEFLTAKGNWEFLARLIKKKQKQYARSSEEFSKWDFEENYGTSVANVKEEYPNYITKIVVEKSNLIKGGVNPTIHFSDGSKKQFKTPKRKLTVDNVGRDAWKNSVLVFDGNSLSWRIGGLAGEPFDSSDPIGGPWDAGSGTIGDFGAFVNFFRGMYASIKGQKDAHLNRGKRQQRWNRKVKGSQGRAGPIPEGWYHVGSKDGMETVPPGLVGDKSAEGRAELQALSAALVKKMSKKFDHSRHKSGKALLRFEKIWRNSAWGQNRMRISERGKGPDGKTVINMSTVYGRGGFFIHGGINKFSSGCIDLSEDMAQFHEFWVKKWLEAKMPSGKVSLYVNYRDNDMKKMSKLISQTNFRNQETEDLPDEEKEKMNQGTGDASWELPGAHAKNVTGCGSSKRPLAPSLKWSSEQFYNTIRSAVPKEILSQERFKNWDKGAPGAKSRLLVAMLQMKLFGGDLEQVDGCFGQGTYKKLKEN